LAKSGELLHDPSIASELIASHLQLKNTQQAREVLQHLDPSQLTAQWQFRFGLLLAQHELFQEAIPFFQHLDSSTTQFHDASFDLAVCYVETRQFPQAIEILRTMSEQGPKTAELDTLLAEAYEDNQQTQAAIDTLREATQLTPEDENSFVNLTALCTKYEAYDVGMKVIETGLHYHPQSDRLIFQRGVMYALTEQWNLAEKDFQLAAKLAPEKNLTYAALGVSYMQAGDPAKAIASLRQRVAEKPQDATLQFLLGQTLMRSGVQPASPELAEAQAALEKAVALDAKSADSRVELAKVYLKDNRLDDSVHLLEQARQIDPKGSTVYLNLVIAYRRAGKPDLAATALAQLNQLNEDQGKRHPNRQRLRMTKEEDPLGSTK
jgi:tetratricopeptide (TPR) repeat protein